MSLPKPLILSIESTCDETAAALVTTGPRVIASVVSSQAALHERFQGVVPEIAARAHMQRMLPVIDETLKQADVTLEALDAVAVANEPGLAGSLVVGLMAAKTLCLVLDKPLIAINHLHAHIYACQFQQSEPVFPCVGLVVSGGHTHLYRCHGPTQFELLGGTIDDAAGEAFDKVASLLGLGYPGGPAISRVAENGNPQAFAFPRSFIRDPERLQFSFSGLKTAVRYALRDVIGDDPAAVTNRPDVVADVAASFQAAVVECLTEKCFHALKHCGLTRLCVGGGVAANRAFRRALETRAARESAQVIVSPPEMCTDNAAMGAIAVEKYRLGQFETVELDIRAGLVRS